MAEVRRRLSLYGDFVIQCCIDQGRVAEVVNSKCESELESKWNIKFKRMMPDELLIEVLIRLPSKCVCRYRAVNKHWRNLISSNHFINRHVNHLRDLNGSHFIPDSFTLVFKNGIWNFLCPSWGQNSSLEVVPLHSNIVLCKSYNSQRFIPLNDTVPTCAVASCRDLLLCACFELSSYYVVNLITKQIMSLPSPPLLDPGQLPAENRGPYSGILCYDIDGVASDWCRFKVILVSVPPEFGSSMFTLRIFCSESGDWTKLVVDWHPWTTKTAECSGQMVPHNGRMYWFTGDSVVSMDLFNGDPNTKLSHVIDLPEGPVGWSPPYTLGVSQGHLCLATFTTEAESSYIQVWQLEDYHKGLWRLLYKSCYTMRFFMMGFHPYRRDAIFVQIERCVYLMDIENVKFDKYLEFKLDEGHSHVFMFSAVLFRHQWFPTPLPSSHPLPTLC